MPDRLGGCCLEAVRRLGHVYVGANNSRDAIELAEYVGRTGASAVSSFPLSNATHSQNVEYYTDIARAAGIPAIVYHLPILTRVKTALDDMIDWLEIEVVVGAKFTDWNVSS